LAQEKSDVLQKNVERFPVGVDNCYSAVFWMHLNFIGNCWYGTQFLFYDLSCVTFCEYRFY